MRQVAAALMSALCVAASQMPARAAVPETVGFQGRLSDTGGDPITDALPITFSLYTVETDGTAIWSETHTAVTVEDGLFSVLLGSVTSFGSAGVDFSEQYWLALNVNSDGEMAPRFKLASAPYAINADMVDGRHASDFLDIPPVPLLTLSRMSSHFSTIEMVLDASASYDPEGETLEFAWDFLGNGEFTAYGSSSSTSYSYRSLSLPYLAAVRVRDPVGRIAEGKALVRIEILPAIVESTPGPTYSCLAVVDGRPAIAYYDSTNADLKFTINSAADGSGTWTVYTVDSDDSVGLQLSLAVVGGRPAISYRDNTNDDLKFAINSAADGSGTWTALTVDSAGDVGYDTSLAVVDDRPAISYFDNTNYDLRFAINSAADGSGTWALGTVDSVGGVGSDTSLGVVDGRPAISYYDRDNSDLKFAINSAPDGSGTWALLTVDSVGGVGSDTSLAVVGGWPAISYRDSTNDDLKFAINSAADGSGTWTLLTVDSEGGVGTDTSLAVVDGRPAISYHDFTNGDLKFAINTAADGLGIWTLVTVDSEGNVGTYTSLAVVDGRPAISYYDSTNGDLKFVISP